MTKMECWPRLAYLKGEVMLANGGFPGQQHGVMLYPKQRKKQLPQ